MPHDGVPDGTVQAILILHSGPRFPQLAGTDPAVNVVRQEPVLMVHKEKEGA